MAPKKASAASKASSASANKALPKSPSKEVSSSSTKAAAQVYPSFHVNDIIYAADSGKLYEAKILKCQQLQGDSMKYFIHYQGWQRKFDVWIDEALAAPLDDKRRVDKLKEKAVELWNPSAKREAKNSKGKKTKLYLGGNKAIDVEQEQPLPASPMKTANTEEPVAEAEDAISTRKSKKRSLATAQSESTHQDDSQSMFMSDNHTAGGKDTNSVAVTADDARKRRRALLLNDLMDEEDSVISARLVIPFPLKKHLTDEWSLVANAANGPRRLSLLPKPSSKCARQAVQDFLTLKQKHYQDQCHKEDKTPADLLADKQELEESELFFASFLNQFEMALPNILLYRYEREQFDKLVELRPEIRLQPSIAYGAEHLLRFFVRLPKLLMTAVLPPDIMDRYLNKLNDFLKFLDKHYEQYFEMASLVPIEEAMTKMDSLEGMQALQAGHKVVLQFYRTDEHDDVVNGKRKRTKSSKLTDTEHL